MTDPPTEDHRRLEATRLIDAVCDDYDDATQTGDILPFGPFLDRVPVDLRRELLHELAGVAFDRLLALGDTNPADRIREQNTELAPELAEAFDDYLLGRATVEHTPRPRGGGLIGPRPSRGLKLRCPHCSNHVELVGDTPLDAVDCTTCGSRFSLVDRSQDTRQADTLQRIDRFELVSRLGLGAFGTVWKARDTELERTVAIKIPRRGQLSPDEIDQFLREARSAARLSHPHIVPVHEVGREGDAVYIVSDLIRGVSMADHLTAKQPSPREAAELCATIGDALEHAHQRGVVHRDLKPSNVMIDSDGKPHLMDFGLAKREVDEVTMTTEGQVLGTPAYMSPEQAGGRSAWADRRTDVYSLGVMLFELLTGELPFRGNAQMQVHQRLVDDAPNARSLNRHVPLDLATIAAKCLEREPGRRYQTAQAVSEELRRHLELRPIHARPLSPLQKLSRWAARNPSRAVACGLVATLAVVGPAIALVIEAQRSRLAALVKEKDRLIERKAEEAADFRSEISTLGNEIDLWRGKVNPWDLWPPTADRPPNKRLLASLLARRGNLLEGSPEDATDLDAALRRTTLGLLYEAEGRPDVARRSYAAAVPALERLRAAEPQSLATAAALRDVYDRLARLAGRSDPEAADRWAASARCLTEEVATERPNDPLVQAERLDRQLRDAVATGFDSNADRLTAAADAERRLADLWPTTITELYRVACELAGTRAPLLDLGSGKRVDAATPASD